MKRQRIANGLLGVCLLGLSAGGWGADFCVDSAGALQTALTTAQANGLDDRVLVVQGTYTGPFVYTSSERKALQVLGGYTAGCGTRNIDAVNTTLQGNGADRVLALTATNGGAFTLEGVTICGGVKTGDGGGLYASTVSDITLRDNLIRENIASGRGGGAYIASEGMMHLERNTFSSNGEHFQPGYGGGLYVFTDHGSLAMSENNFTDNTACCYGGGVALYTNLGTLNLVDNTIDGNWLPSGASWNYGGGIWINVASSGTATLVGNRFANSHLGCSYGCQGSGGYVSASIGTVVLTDNSFTNNSQGGGARVTITSGVANLFGNVFTANSSASKGGGAYMTATSGAITLAGNSLDINSANDSGGGVYISTEGGPATLAGNVFYTNTAAHGGGVSIQTAGIATLTNNTLENNAGSIDGGGLWLTATSETKTASLYNNLLWNNHAPVAGDLYLNNDSNNNGITSPLDLMRNNFNPTLNSGYWTKIAITIDPTNLNLDPLFDATDTQHLSASSPMIDLGDNNAPARPAIDIDGEARIMGSAVDIGADEYSRTPPTNYSLTVAKTGTGTVKSGENPPKIDCGSTCSFSYSEGATVTLQATAVAPWSFDYWSGACTGGGSCQVTMTANTSVTAHFTNPENYKLGVVTSGSGTVTSTDGGINCGSVCDAEYPKGTNVALCAAPATGWVLTEWGGACTGANSCCTVTMDADRSLYATFECSAQTLISAERASSDWLDLAYAVRDQVLPRVPQGDWMIQAYYRDSAEVSGRFLTDRGLRIQALSLFKQLAPSLKAAVQGGDLRLDPSARLALRRFVATLREGGSPELKGDLDTFVTLF